MLNETSLMSGSSSSSSSTELCDAIYKTYHFYVERILNLTGLVLNTLNLIVYIRLINSRKAHGNMYKYLVFKSIMDAYNSLRNLVYVLYDTNKIFGLQRYLVATYFYLIFIVYAGDIAQLMSILCEVGACYSRFRKVYTVLVIIL